MSTNMAQPGREVQILAIALHSATLAEAQKAFAQLQQKMRAYHQQPGGGLSDNRTCRVTRPTD